jgi:N-acetylglutamate synthase-like GNAT family acetyltransferase
VKEKESFFVRTAIAADQTSIKSLIRHVRINPLNLDWKNFHVAISENGRMIGCGQIKTHRDGTQELASIAVEVDWRRRGIASAIIRSLMRDAGTPLWLICRSEMGSFYEQFGFQIVEHLDQMPRAYRRMRGVARFVSRLFPSADDFHIMILDLA